MNALDGSSRMPKPKTLCFFRLEEWLLLCIRESRLQRTRTFPRMALDSAESHSRTTLAHAMRLTPFSRKRETQVQRCKAAQARAGSLLGRVFRGLCRPGWILVGGRMEPMLSNLGRRQYPNPCGGLALYSGNRIARASDRQQTPYCCQGRSEWAMREHFVVPSIRSR
jgi:hypothetical protein